MDFCLHGGLAPLIPTWFKGQLYIIPHMVKSARIRQIMILSNNCRSEKVAGIKKQFFPHHLLTTAMKQASHYFRNSLHWNFLGGGLGGYNSDPSTFRLGNYPGSLIWFRYHIPRLINLPRLFSLSRVGTGKSLCGGSLYSLWRHLLVTIGKLSARVLMR